MSAPASSILRILVVDDSSDWRDLISSLLRVEQGWQVIEASDGHQAIQKAIELHPDIVVLDIGMPVLNGLDAAREIRRVSTLSRIVFCTQCDDGEVRNAALAAGAGAYVLKANAARELLPTLRGNMPADS